MRIIENQEGEKFMERCFYDIDKSVLAVWIFFIHYPMLGYSYFLFVIFFLQILLIFLFMNIDGWLCCGFCGTEQVQQKRSNLHKTREPHIYESALAIELQVLPPRQFSFKMVLPSRDVKRVCVFCNRSGSRTEMTPVTKNPVHREVWKTWKLRGKVIV